MERLEQSSLKNYLQVVKLSFDTPKPEVGFETQNIPEISGLLDNFRAFKQSSSQQNWVN